MEPYPAIGSWRRSEGLQTCRDAPVISREKKSHLCHAGVGGEERGSPGLGVPSLSK